MKGCFYGKNGIFFKHQCGEWVLRTFYPLTLETTQKVTLLFGDLEKTLAELKTEKSEGEK